MIRTTTRQDGETGTSPRSFQAHCLLRRTTPKKFDLDFTLKASPIRRLQHPGHTTSAHTCTAVDRPLLTVCIVYIV